MGAPDVVDLEKDSSTGVEDDDAEAAIQHAIGMIYAGFGFLVLVYMLFVIVAASVSKRWWHAVVAVAVATLVLLVGLYVTAALKKKIDKDFVASSSVVPRDDRGSALND